MRKKLWLLCLLVLCACTYLPDTSSPTPVPCPTLAPCTVISVLPTQPPTAIPTATAEILPDRTPTQPEPTAEAPVAVSQIPSQAALTYAPELGTPRLEADFAHPGQGCAWIGIAGQVLDAKGEAETNHVLAVTGVFNGENIDQVSLSGSAPTFGPGGFVVRLPGQVAAPGQLSIQLFDLQGAPLSNPVAFQSPQTCEQTLVLLNFRRQP